MLVLVNNRTANQLANRQLCVFQDFTFTIPRVNTAGAASTLHGMTGTVNDVTFTCDGTQVSTLVVVCGL